MSYKCFSTISSSELIDKQSTAEMQQFRQKVLIFLDSTNASSEIQYHLTRDLAKRMNLPFFKSKEKRGIRNRMKSNDIVKEYCKLCVKYYKENPNNIGFIEKLLQQLSEQQKQHMRKLSPCPPKQEAKKAKIKKIRELKKPMFGNIPFR